MKAQEKSQIYNLLKTISSFINGYTPNFFSNNTPSFTDDIELSNKNEQPLDIQPAKEDKTQTDFYINDFGIGINTPTVFVICQNPNIQLLEKMLSAINLFKNKNCFITNELILQNPNTLKNLLLQLKPKMILAMGQNICNELLQNQNNLSETHGQFFSFENIPCMSTFDTTPLLENPTLKATAWDDLKKFKAQLLFRAPDYEK